MVHHRVKSLKGHWLSYQWCSNQNLKVVEGACGCHNVNLANHEQLGAVDVDLLPTPCEMAAVAGPTDVMPSDDLGSDVGKGGARGRGKGKGIRGRGMAGKGKDIEDPGEAGKGKGGGDLVGGKAGDNKLEKPQAPPTFIASMVRGSNLMQLEREHTGVNGSFVTLSTKILFY